MDLRNSDLFGPFIARSLVLSSYPLRSYLLPRLPHCMYCLGSQSCWPHISGHQDNLWHASQDSLSAANFIRWEKWKTKSQQNFSKYCCFKYDSKSQRFTESKRKLREKMQILSSKDYNFSMALLLESAHPFEEHLPWLHLLWRQEYWEDHVPSPLINQILEWC